MKQRFLAAGALACALAVACSSTSSDKAQMAVDKAAADAKWIQYATPGDAHKALDGHVGTWSLKVRLYAPDGSMISESEAASECRWIMDGRYLEDVTNGVFMGMTFSGRGVAGYDNMKHKYCTTWIDNMGTGIMTSEGTYDASTRTFHYTTEAPDMATGELAPTRTTEQMIDPDHWTMTMYGPNPDGKEYKSMQIDYMRRR